MSQQEPLTTSRIGLPFSEKKIIPQNTEQTKIRLFPSESHLFRGTEKAWNSIPNHSAKENTYNSIPNPSWQQKKAQKSVQSPS
jgi:hypothetical protein